MENPEQLISDILRNELHFSFSDLQIITVGGGSINDTFRVGLDNGKNFFLKLNSERKYPSLFEKERTGLIFIDQQNIIRVPEIIACNITSDVQWLLMEWIETGIRDQVFWRTFGEQLARLHRVTDRHFGFHEDNYMGALVQKNTCIENWVDFFLHHRLQPQIKLARDTQLLHSGHLKNFEALSKKLISIFNEENPSLLHGDLWGGNYLCNATGQPVIIDPAVYFGHRSMDLAMTNLFGGFDRQFYDAYNYHFPFPPDYQDQWEVCNLYPLLIHLNLFGSSYLRPLENILKKFS